MDIAPLTTQNPWWISTERIQDDPKIQTFQEAAYPWRPELLKTIDLTRDLIYSLRGPRQVGKTTFVKLLIQHLLETEEHRPQGIFYYPCDLINSDRELADLLTTYLDFKTPWQPKRAFLFLDEISAVPNWQKAIKFLTDAGHLRNCTVLVTGSHTVDIKTGLELLPGRRGDASSKLDLKLLPLSFRTFVQLMVHQHPELPLTPDQKELLTGSSLQMLEEARSGKLSPHLLGLLDMLPHLNHFLDQYLLTGGFITAINEYLTTGSIREYIYDIYLSWLIGDLHKLGKSDTNLRQIVQAVLDTLTTPVSWNGLSRRTSVSSHHTATDYVEMLEYSFVLHVIPFYDPMERTIRFRKNRKLYFSDPFIGHVFRWWTHRAKSPFEQAHEVLADPTLKSQWIESAVAAHLKRSYEVGYWQDRYGYEVDFLVQQEDALLPIEVKFREQMAKSDFKALEKLKGGLILTRTRWDVRGAFLFIPTALYLLLLPDH